MRPLPGGYLPPESSPWERAVNDTIYGLETRVGLTEQNTLNGFAQLASSAAGLGTTIRGLISATSVSGSASGFGLTTSFADKATVDLAVPDGTATAIVMISGSVSSRVTNTGSSNFRMETRITAASSGGSSGGNVGAPAYEFVSSTYVPYVASATSYHQVAYSNPPASIALAVQALCAVSGTYNANAASTASIQALAIFLRPS
jgi:hypothetical protein